MSLLRAATDAVAFGATAAAAIGRAGAIRPGIPTPALLSQLLQAPFRGIHLGTAVALHAAARPQEAAIVDDDGVVTWAELDQRINRFAQTLMAAGGGRSVAFLLRNGREAIECYCAAFRAGMSAVPVNTWLQQPDINTIIGRHDPAVVVCSAEFQDKAAGDWTTLITGAGDSYERALAAAAPDAPKVRGAGRIVTYTSGTTGGPKGAERSLSTGALGPGVRFLDKVPLRATDTFLVAPPLFHALAQGMAAAGLALGCTLALPSRPDPEEILAATRGADVTALCLVPIMLRRLLDSGVAKQLPPLRLAVVSGSHLPGTLRDGAQEVLGPIIYDLYGSTEVGWATISTPDDHERKRGSVGRPSRGMRVQILDDDGRPQPAGEEGRIVVRTGLEFSGYTETGERSEGGIDMGDRGHVDADGYLYVTGRGDDMVVVGGENVQPADVEAVIDEHPGVEESAVMGVEDDDYGQVLAAYVVRADGSDLSEEEVVSHARSRLARYQVPRRVSFVTTLPRNPAGKVVKRMLTSPEGDRS